MATHGGDLIFRSRSYLKNRILPIAKFSFYSGNVTHSVVANLFNLFDHCKELLDTNGNAWGAPITDFSEFPINIEPLNLKEVSSEEDAMKACGNLALNQNDDDNEEDMLVPLPKIETEETADLSTIWLPLKRKHIFNINSRTSAFILFRYFVLVSQCYGYQGISQGIFNRKLKAWILEEVLPYLEDEKLYPAFGAVLRILETVKDAKDDGYHGSKIKSAINRQRAGGHRLFNDEDTSYLEDFDEETGVDWWMQLAIFITGGLLLLILLIFLFVRCCKRCRKGQDSSDSPEKPGVKQKVKKFFWKSSHRPDADEYYQYKKVPGSVAVENEKKNKPSWMRKQPKQKEAIKLPLLGSGAESEDDVVLHDIAKVRKNAKFKISESSDDSSIRKKPSRPALKTPKPKSGVFGRIRSRSPQKKVKLPDGSTNSV